MKRRTKPDFNNLNFAFTIDNKSLALIVDFKGAWTDEVFARYGDTLSKFLAMVDTEKYTLVLNCIQFKIPIPVLKAVVRPFLEAYRDAGFRHVRLMTESPQKEFRRIVKLVNTKIGFDLQFCDSTYKDQEVYIG